MIIPTPIAKRVAKMCKLKPELQTPFIQGDREYITNTFFMVDMKKTEDQKEDGRELPIMSIAYERSMPKGEATRFDIEYLIDSLSILKANSAKYVDIKIGDYAMHLKGLSTWSDSNNTVDLSALIMKVTS